MNLEVQRFFVVCIAALLPALLLIASAGYNVFMYVKANRKLTMQDCAGGFGSFSILFGSLNSADGKNTSKERSLLPLPLLYMLDLFCSGFMF